MFTKMTLSLGKLVVDLVFYIAGESLSESVKHASILSPDTKTKELPSVSEPSIVVVVIVLCVGND